MVKLNFNQSVGIDQRSPESSKDILTQVFAVKINAITVLSADSTQVWEDKDEVKTRFKGLRRKS